MSTLSYFTDKLSAETRVLIYGFVFGSSTHVKRTTSSEKLPANAKKDERIILFERRAPTEPVLVATSDFAASKMTSGEAMETFYNTKTVRLEFTQLHQDLEVHADYLNVVRNLEFIDCFNHFIYQPDQIMQNALIQALQLPKIKSVSVLSEYLAYNPNHPGYGGREADQECSCSVRDFANGAGLGEVTSVDIGRYEITEGKFKGLRFSNSKLLKMWPAVKSTPEGYDGYVAATDVLREWHLSGYPANLNAFASQTSLRVWVGLYEQWLHRVEKEAPAPPPGQIFNGEWYDRMSVGRYLKERRPDVSVFPQGRHGDTVPLHRLGPEHDAETLEWATEFLALNIETFSYMRDGFLVEPADAKAYWPEVDGGRGIGDVESSWHQEARENFEQNYLVEVPCKEGHYWDLDMIKDRLLDDPVNLGRIVFGEDHIKTAGKDALRQMFHLMVAMGIWATQEEGDDADVDAWSASLLKKYLPGTDLFDNQELEAADLQKLRRVFKLAVAMIMLQHDEGAVSSAMGPAAEDEEANGSDEGDIHLPFLRKTDRLLRQMWTLQTALDGGLLGALQGAQREDGLEEAVVGNGQSGEGSERADGTEDVVVEG